VQLQLGGDFAGGSIDGYYAKKKDAIATAPLSATQVGIWPDLRHLRHPAG